MTALINYDDLPVSVRKALGDLEMFITDLDGQDIDDGTVDAEDAVKAFNSIVAALRAYSPLPTERVLTELLRSKICGLYQECDDEPCICRDGARAVLALLQACEPPTSPMPEINTSNAPFHAISEDEANEAGDNGRNTGGKSYYRPPFHAPEDGK